MFWRTLPISSAYACSQPFDFLGPPTLQILTVVRYSVVFCFRHTSPSDLIDFQNTVSSAASICFMLITPGAQTARCRLFRRLVGEPWAHSSVVGADKLAETAPLHDWMRYCSTISILYHSILFYIWYVHSTLLHLLRYPNVSDVSVVRIKLHTTPLDERQLPRQLSTQRGKANRKGCHKRKSWHILLFRLNWKAVPLEQHYKWIYIYNIIYIYILYYIILYYIKLYFIILYYIILYIYCIYIYIVYIYILLYIIL